MAAQGLASQAARERKVQTDPSALDVVTVWAKRYRSKPPRLLRRELQEPGRWGTTFTLIQSWGVSA